MNIQSHKISLWKNSNHFAFGTNASPFKTALAYFIHNWKCTEAKSIGLSIFGFPGSGLMLTAPIISTRSPFTDLVMAPPTFFSHMAWSSFLQSKFLTKCAIIYYLGFFSISRRALGSVTFVHLGRQISEMR